MDGFPLRMLLPMGDLVRPDMQHPEQVDGCKRHKYHHHPRDGIGGALQGLSAEEGGERWFMHCQQAKARQQILTQFHRGNREIGHQGPVFDLPGTRLR
ncbi:hypothetical protein D3C72_2011830 [compost metagenome]